MEQGDAGDEHRDAAVGEQLAEGDRLAGVLGALAAAGKSEGDDGSGATTAKKKAAAKKAEAPKAEDKPEEKAEEAPKADETAPDTDTDSSGVTTENPVQPAEGADDASAEPTKADEAGA